ncbi:MAG TPA: Nif3-like dinuclear metal center hexameric protein [Gemmatimonadaceae bacterium]|nr:Nif3-like dinuclear metal center hexameric protein [Gemmatimonadaceae bacterium]
MTAALLGDIAKYLDELLEIATVPDYPNAVNGLQMSSSGKVTRVAAAVDFSSQSVARAIDEKADLLIVHHGMFWSGLEPIRGVAYDRVKQMVEAGLAVYSSHLPLDRHPRLGNNVLLAAELDLKPSAGFARFQTIDIGLHGESDIETRELASRAAAFATAHGGTLRTTPVAPGRRTRKWAICTGGGASADTLREAAERGIDTLIVGEGAHWTAVHAADNDLVILYAGHYATETLGVRALAKHVGERFKIPSLFLSLPTGL